MSNCIGEPVSFLRLERYHLHELADPELREIERHLEQCDACRECLREVERPLALTDLPARPRKASWRADLTLPIPAWLRAARWPALAVAGAAVALMVIWRGSPSVDYPNERMFVKGGEFAIELVREHAGVVANDPRVFTSDDRFKVLVTCPPSTSHHVDVVVFQGNDVDFPLKAERFASCGNRIPLPGAFYITGSTEATVCLVANASRAVNRDELRARGPRALPELSVCERIRPVR
jgi:hypothetical protein